MASLLVYASYGVLAALGISTAYNYFCKNQDFEVLTSPDGTKRKINGNLFNYLFKSPCYKCHDEQHAYKPRHRIFNRTFSSASDIDYHGCPGHTDDDSPRCSVFSSDSEDGYGRHTGRKHYRKTKRKVGGSRFELSRTTRKAKNLFRTKIHEYFNPPPKPPELETDYRRHRLFSSEDEAPPSPVLQPQLSEEDRDLRSYQQQQYHSAQQAAYNQSYRRVNPQSEYPGDYYRPYQPSGYTSYPTRPTDSQNLYHYDRFGRCEAVTHRPYPGVQFRTPYQGTRYGYY